ncbi:MAG: DnaJ domain-containing protein [Nitrosopumilus sp.]|nr:MAG: DnaJ domain-containing protein [Nitrosopumilus sp.]
MNTFSIIAVVMLAFGGLHVAEAQNTNLDMELEVSDDEKIILFSGFAVAVIAIVMFLARDIILRKKTPYDKENLESQRDKTFEKYHSDWGDDYEELGQRRNTKQEKEFRDAANNNELPNYYDIIGVSKNSTPDEIKKKFRELAKKTHPDKTKEDSEDKMAELNKAYEVLSDKELREKYDRYLNVG